MRTVIEAFEDFKSNLELSSSLQEAVSTHHNAVRHWIQSRGLNIKTKLIGSLQRKTRIQPRFERDSFDIDILVILGGFKRWTSSGGISPSDALDKVEALVAQNETYLRMGPETDSPAITLEYADDVNLELVPAYRDQVGNAPDGTPTPPANRGYWIPKNDRWEIADYDYDAQYVSEANAEAKGHLVPTLKMLKAVKREHFSQMQSYHLEVLATPMLTAIVNHFQETGQLLSYPDLVYRFFLLSKDEVLKPAAIPGSKSPNADLYMGETEKQSLSRIFGTIANHCENTLSLSDEDAVKAWRRLFGQSFPSQ